MNRELPSNDKGNLETIKVMKNLARKYQADPLVRQLAKNIVIAENIPSSNYLDEAKAIARYVQSHVRYMRDPEGMEQIHDPIMMIRDMQKGVSQGDCDDMALLIATLLLSIGASPFFSIVRYKANDGPFNHVYVVVYDRNWRGPRQRVALDAIIKDRDIGYEVPHQSRMEIEV